MRVLIVEDQSDHRELVALLLARKGYAVRSAPSVDEAMAMLRTDAFDVVLLDVMMPNKDGYTFLEELRTLGPEKEPRVIALTALGMREDRERLLAAGCEGVVTKPISSDDLCRVLKRTEKESR